MADWILNFTKAGVKVKKQLSAQARQLLDVLREWDRRKAQVGKRGGDRDKTGSHGGWTCPVFDDT